MVFFAEKENHAYGDVTAIQSYKGLFIRFFAPVSKELTYNFVHV